MNIYKQITILTLSMSLVGLSHAADDMAGAKSGMTVTENSAIAAWTHNWSTTGKEKKKGKANMVSSKVNVPLEEDASQVALTEFAEKNNMTNKSYGEVCGAFVEGEMTETKRGGHRWGKSDSHWSKKSFKIFKAREFTGGEEELAQSAGHLFGKTRKTHNCITTKVGINDENVELESMKLTK
ncbi:hypothetical protein IP485_13085 [Psychrobacter sp. NG27]|nr:hypothetical protein [Psychrobacter sp. NG27]